LGTWKQGAKKFWEIFQLQQLFPFARLSFDHWFTPFAEGTFHPSICKGKLTQTAFHA